MIDSDVQLIRACCNSDGAAWKVLIDRYRRLIFSVPVNAFRFSRSDAEDVVQQVLTKLLQNIKRLRRVESLPAWLIAVARNECLRVLCESSCSRPLDIEAERALTSAPVDLDEELYEMECEHRLSEALKQLDDASLAFLRALYVEEPTPSYAQLAARMGRPLNSLGPTRSRCLRKVRRLYEKADATPMAAGSAPRLSTHRDAAPVEARPLEADEELITHPG